MTETNPLHPLYAVMETGQHVFAEVAGLYGKAAAAGALSVRFVDAKCLDWNTPLPMPGKVRKRQVFDIATGGYIIVTTTQRLDPGLKRIIIPWECDFPLAFLSNRRWRRRMHGVQLVLIAPSSVRKPPGFTRVIVM